MVHSVARVRLQPGRAGAGNRGRRAAGGEPGSVVCDVLDHRLRSGDRRAGRRGAVPRLHRGRGRAVRHSRCRRGGDASGRQPAVRSQGDRTAQTGAEPGGGREAHHRRRSRPRHPSGRRDRHQRPLRRLHRQARHRSEFRSERFRAPGRLRGTRHRPQFFGAGQHARQRRRREEHGARLRTRQGHDGRAADGRARRRPVRRRRHARHAVGRPPRRPADPARLRFHRRAHRRHSRGRCGRSVQGAAAAAEHHARRAQEADRRGRRSSRKAGKFDDAIAEERKALEIQPNSDALHYALAQRYAEAGQPLQALVPLREAIRLHPNLAREAARDPVFAKMRDLGEFKRLVRIAAVPPSGGVR